MFKNNIADIVAKLKQDLAGIRTNRPHPSLVEDIKIDYYGTPTPIKNIASLSIAPPREIDISVWDAGAVKAVVRAIEDSPLGVTANAEGNLVRVFLPELSEERRDEFIRLAKKKTEERKIELRRLRDETNKEIEQKFHIKEITEDEKFKIRENVQKETDEANKKIEALLETKIQEIKS